MRRNIIITGASSGLGEGMAREFAKRGRHLALCARRTDRLDALKRELEPAHPDVRVHVRALDVTDHEQVFAVFRAFQKDFGGRVDRVIVNAGIGKGAPVGRGKFWANKATLETNVIAALAQCEAAVEIFREQDAGHLVTVSSVSAVRGMRKSMTAYAASKAALRSLSEGMRMDLMRTPIRVTTLLPGYIRTELNEKVKNAPLMVERDEGARALVRAIEREPAEAFVPWWPWAPVAFLLKRVPLKVVRRVV